MIKTKQLLRAIYKRLKRPNKRTLTIGQRIRLHKAKLFFLGGAWSNIRVYVEPFYILEYYKENETYFYFRVICNSEHGAAVGNGSLVFIEKESFNKLKYT
jgi:hypothetical protein